MVKVAFFTNDLKNIDAHFGSAPQFAVYDVDSEGFSLFEVVPTGEEKTEGRVEMLQDIASMINKFLIFRKKFQGIPYIDKSFNMSE